MMGNIPIFRENMLGLLGRHIPALTILPLTYFIVRLTLVPTVWPEKAVFECLDPPYNGCGFIFDEAHYIPAVRKMLLGENVNLEHPPLTKILIALGIGLLGDNPWGWRTINIAFSAMSISLVGLLAYRVSKEIKLAMVSQMLIVTDVTFFNVGGFAMLDPPSIFFMLLSLYLLLMGKRVLSGLAMGLALLSKISAFIGLVAVIAVDAAHSYLKTRDLDAAVALIRECIRYVALPSLIVFVVGLGIFNGVTGAFPTPFHHLSYMLDYHSNLRYTDVTKIEPPLSWIIPPISRQPAPYYVITVEPLGWHPLAFWGVSSPLWWSVWLAIPLAYSDIKRSFESRKAIDNPNPHVTLLSWIAVNMGLFAFLAYILKRFVYLFYFLQISPVIAAFLPSVMQHSKYDLALKVLLIGQIIWFLMFLPVKPFWLIESLNILGLGEVPWR